VEREVTEEEEEVGSWTISRSRQKRRKGIMEEDIVEDIAEEEKKQ
jgi:hypothetical protein